MKTRLGTLNYWVEATIRSYLEKKVTADPGPCLVKNTKLNIIGIADLVPGQQTE